MKRATTGPPFASKKAELSFGLLQFEYARLHTDHFHRDHLHHLRLVGFTSTHGPTLPNVRVPRATDVNLRTIFGTIFV